MGTIFSDSDIRVHLGEPGVTEYIWNVGKAFAEWLPDEGSVVVVQSQSSEKSVAHAFIEGLLLQGRSVFDAGIGGQQVAYAALSESKSAGAAHLDFIAAQNLAIISFYDSHGMIVSLHSGLSEINELVQAGNFLPAAIKGTIIKS